MKLDRDLIVATALAIIDEDGLPALSMRKLGGRLGVDPMAVYYHLPNKAALFDGVVEAILRELDRDLETTADNAIAVITAYRDVLRRHPHALPVVSTRPVRGPASLAVFERILGVFLRDGFDLASAVSAVTCLVEFTIGHVVAAEADPYGGESPFTIEVDLPNITAAVEQGAWLDADASYDLGLRSMLDGLRSRLTDR